jgi:hypothetical protein
MREFKDSVTGKDKDELPERSADKPEPRAAAEEPEREPATTASEHKP